MKLQLANRFCYEQIVPTVLQPCPIFKRRMHRIKGDQVTLFDMLTFTKRTMKVELIDDMFPVEDYVYGLSDLVDYETVDVAGRIYLIGGKINSRQNKMLRMNCMLEEVGGTMWL